MAEAYILVRNGVIEDVICNSYVTVFVLDADVDTSPKIEYLGTEWSVEEVGDTVPVIATALRRKIEQAFWELTE